MAENECCQITGDDIFQERYPASESSLCSVEDV